MVGDKMRILFVCTDPVPFGMASTNRLLSLAKGIQVNGHEAIIFILNPTEPYHKVLNSNSKGEYDGIKYRYLSDNTIIPKNKFLKLFRFLLGLINLIPQVIKLHFSGSIDAIVISPAYSIYPLILFPLTRILNITFIHERSEYPFLSQHKDLFWKIDYLIYTKIVVKLFDGFFLITKALVEYFEPLVKKSAKLKLILMTVDPDRFEFNNHPRSDNRPYIAYAGNYGGDKDGVSDLIEAFALVNKKFPDLFLFVIGETANKTVYTKLKGLAESLGIGEKVVFTGRIERDDMPSYLLNAQLLLLARPANIQAKGGFPTKLGEYLTTGRPVVITKVGEIPDYLTDGENAFMAEPDNPLSFALKVEEALTDTENARAIGLNGKKLAVTIFNYKTQGLEMIDFIKSLKHRDNTSS